MARTTRPQQPDDQQPQRRPFPRRPFPTSRGPQPPSVTYRGGRPIRGAAPDTRRPEPRGITGSPPALAGRRQSAAMRNFLQLRQGHDFGAVEERLSRLKRETAALRESRSQPSAIPAFAPGQPAPGVVPAFAGDVSPEFMDLLGNEIPLGVLGGLGGFFLGGPPGALLGAGLLGGGRYIARLPWARQSFLGDIFGTRPRPIQPPAQPLDEWRPAQPIQPPPTGFWNWSGWRG